MRRLPVFLVFSCALACLALGPVLHPATAEDDDASSSSAGSGGSSTLTADQLEKLVAPIALYPDKLLSNTLRASTVPLQIVQAARYLSQKSSGGDADESQTKNWDKSVQALLHYPKVVKEMNDKLDWTSELGQAVIHQQKDVMNAVQADRARAAQEDALKTNDQVQVTTQPAPDGGDAPIYVIQPTDPTVTYVPTYDPAYLYPGHVGTGAAFAVGWGAGFAAGTWMSGGVNWSHGDITVNNYNSFNANSINANRVQANHNDVWQHPQSINNAWSQGAHKPAAWNDAGGIGSFGNPNRPNGGAGSRGDGDRGAGDLGGGDLGGGDAGRLGGSGDRGGSGLGGDRGGSGFGGGDRGSGQGGFQGGSAGGHFGGLGAGGSQGHGGGAFSGLGGGGFHNAAADRGGFSRGGFGGGGGRGGGGGGFRGGGRRR